MHRMHVTRRGDHSRWMVALLVCLGCAFDLGPLPSAEPSTSSAEGDTTGAHEPGDRGDATTDEDDSTSTSGGLDPSTSGDPANECCEPSGAVGCLDSAIERCVCARDAHCCETAWDELCVEKVTAFRCGECLNVFDTDARCCRGNDRAGCADAAVEACVCAVNPYCCHVAWDTKCADLVEPLGCGECGASPSDASGCCAAHDFVSCDDPEVAACVCAFDPYCCDESWDEVCVAAVDAYGCGTCDETVPGVRGDCCAPQQGAGCDDPATEQCVCDFDPFCCQVAWDELCVDGATTCAGCAAGETDGPIEPRTTAGS